MTIKIENYGSILVGALIIWYLARRTDLTSTFIADIKSIPEYFTSFIGVSTPTIRTEYDERRKYFRR